MKKPLRYTKVGDLTYDAYYMHILAAMEPAHVERDMRRAFSEMPWVQEIRTNLGAMTREAFEQQTKGLPAGA
jgi:hypothetical protein